MSEQEALEEAISALNKARSIMINSKFDRKIEKVILEIEDLINEKAWVIEYD